MKLLRRKSLPGIFLLALYCLLAACEQKTATVSELAKPLPGSPVPKPTPPPSVDAKRTDLNRVVVGTTPPDFALEEMNKKIVRLSDFRGKQAVVLVFYRGVF